MAVLFNYQSCGVVAQDLTSRISKTVTEINKLKKQFQRCITNNNVVFVSSNL